MKNSKRVIFIIPILTLCLCIITLAAPTGAGDASAKFSGTVVAGGDGRLHSAYLPTFGDSQAVTKVIKLKE